MLRAYIMTRISPKSAQLKQYEIKPLSLHKRSYLTNEPKHMNQLNISGNFTFNEAHTWVMMCIPETSEKISSKHDGSSVSSPGQVIYNYESTFTRTMLNCIINKGMITFKSDNISTISIIKDFITREATKKSIAIDMSVDINELSLSDTLKKLYPKLKSLITIRNNNDLLLAINEVASNDPAIAKELMSQLIINVNSEDEDEDEDDSGKNCNQNLERIYGLITDLFIDYHKFNRTSNSVLPGIKTRLNEMISLIETYSADQYNENVLIDKLNQFWGLQTINN